jgi:hypothetical protein
MIIINIFKKYINLNRFLLLILCLFFAVAGYGLKKLQELKRINYLIKMIIIINIIYNCARLNHFN